MQLKGAKVLVTGGAGFLGRHLLPLLLAEGAEICCLVRSQASAARLPAGVKAILGDCNDAGQTARAAGGQEIIIHMAGLLFGSAWRNYLAANGRMAQNLANAAQNETALRKFVFVSSLAAAGPCAQVPGRSEAMPWEPVSAYGWAKLLAERTVIAALGQKAVILRPPIIYGSGDKGMLPLFRAAARGFGVGRNFPVSAIHGSDCARAIMLLCGKDSEGVYHLNDGNIYSMDDLSLAMGRALGREQIKLIHPPLPVMAASAAIAGACYSMISCAARAIGCEAPAAPQWNMDKYREAAQCGWVADGRRLERLGFRAEIDLDDGMAEAAAFYRREGWL